MQDAIALRNEEDDSDFSGEEDQESAWQEVERVRRFSSSEQGGRRNSVSAAPVSETMMENWKGAPVYEKSAEDVARIKSVIRDSSALHVLFGHLKCSAIDDVVNAMFSREAEVGEVIIEQGADGDFFYIVDSGLFDIFVKRQGTVADEPAERVQGASAGSSFGELALMYNTARAATVKCVEVGRLWCLDRDCFQMTLVTSENTRKKKYEGFLSQVDVLSSLTPYELAKLSDLLELQLFSDAEEVVRQGEEGTSMYFVYEGECEARMGGEHGEVEVKRYSTPGEYFGEVALVMKEPRRATVRACGSCIVLVLRKEDVDLSVGDLRARLLANIETYPQYEVLAHVGM